MRKILRRFGKGRAQRRRPPSEQLLCRLVPDLAASDARTFAAALGGHPGALQILGRTLAHDPGHREKVLEFLRRTEELSEVDSAKPSPLSAVIEFALSKAAPEASALWAALSLFQGDFDGEEAAAVAGMDAAATRKRLEKLSALGLVITLPDGRFSLPAPLRDAAAARLERSGSSEDIHRRYAQFYASRGLVFTPQALEPLASLLERYRTGPRADPSKRTEILHALDSSLAGHNPAEIIEIARSIAGVAVRHGDRELERIGVRRAATAMRSPARVKVVVASIMQPTAEYCC